MTLNLQPGDTFHTRYEILSKLGAGAVGTVYRARQVDSGREVAVKLLHKEGLESEKDRARFLREFKILSKLSHEHIITFYSAAINEEGYPYAVCEFIEGKNLLNLIQEEEKLSWPRTWKIMEQVCQAMQYAHDNGIIHRDLKPENIMLIDQPEPDWVKVLDFGFARAINPTQTMQRLTATGMILGTVCYMSPEQCQAQELDGRSDVYALACILYECLTGKLLFEAEDPLSVVRMHLQVDPAPNVAELQSQVPDELLKILLKGLTKDPNKRYQSMAAFAKALQAVADNPKSVISLAPASSTIKGRFSKTQLIAASVAAIMIAVLSVALSIKKQNAVQKVLHEKPKKSSKTTSHIHIDTEALYARAEMQRRRGDLLGARESLTTAIRALTAKHQSTLQCKLLYSKVLHALGENKLAQEAASEALGMARREYGKNSREYMKALADMGSAISTTDLRQGKSYLRSALRIWETLDSSPDPELIELLATYVNCFKLEKSSAAALEAEKELSKWAARFDDPETSPAVRESFLVLYAGVVLESGDKIRAEKIADQGTELLEILESDGRPVEFGQTHSMWASIYHQSGKSKKGIMEMRKTQSLIIEHRYEPIYLLAAYLAEAVMQHSAGADEEAIKVLDKAFKVNEKSVHSDHHAGQIWLTKAQCYLSMSQPSLSLSCIKKAKSTYSEPSFIALCNETEEKALSLK